MIYKKYLNCCHSFQLLSFLLALLSPCSGLHAQLTGTAGADDVSLTSANTGELNSSPFSGISSIDTVQGSDTVNTNASTTLTGINGQVITNGVTVSNFENLVSTDGNLVGSGSSETFAITGADSGSAYSVGYSGIGNLSGGDGNDTFDFGASGSLSGTINGGAGIDVLDYSDKSGSVAVALSDNSATSLNGGANSGFSSIEGVIGNGTANTVIFSSGLSDSFIIGATNGDAGNFGVSAATINAGGGSDTLTGTSGGDSFAITGADTGSVGGVNFSSVENLNGGAGNDTFSYTGSGQTSGDINGGADLDTITIDVGALGTFTFSGQIDNVEDIDLNGGTLVLNGSLTNGGTLDLATGTVLAGTGSIEAAQVNLNGGTIAPGTSPGTLSIDADLTAGAASTFSFELNGLAPGTEFDQILFTGLGNRGA